MVSRRFWKDEDQKLFIKLVRSGLKELQAVEQMKLLGIHEKISNPFWKDEISPRPRSDNEQKNRFPHYHHKRRW